jgi:hypothetical protein
MINWDPVPLPAQIWGYVDLRSLATGMRVPLRNGMLVEKGGYAIIESCEYVPIVPKEDRAPGEEDPITSDLFTEIVLDTELLNEDGEVALRKFYLVDVETFLQPIVVIPNIGAMPKCKYLLMTPKSEWAEKFVQWIDLPHELDEEQMAPTDDEDEEDGDEEDEDEEDGDEDEEQEQEQDNSDEE